MFLWNISCAGFRVCLSRSVLAFVMILFDSCSLHSQTVDESSSLLNAEGICNVCRSWNCARLSRKCPLQKSFLKLSDFSTSTSFGVYLHLYHALCAFTLNTCTCTHACTLIVVQFLSLAFSLSLLRLKYTKKLKLMKTKVTKIRPTSCAVS